MNIPVQKIESVVRELLTVLDDDICYINISIEKIGQLKAAVIKRDEQDLRETMQLLESSRSQYQNVEQRRESLRGQLAKLFQCSPEDMTLSRLIEILEESRSQLAEQIRAKQKQLRSLVSKMKREHTGAIMLLRECARFNSMLIRSIFGDRKNVTYTADGSSSWDARRGLLSYKL